MVNEGPRFPTLGVGDDLAVAERVLSEDEEQVVRRAAQALRKLEGVSDEENLRNRVTVPDPLEDHLLDELYLDSIVLRSERPVFTVRDGSFDLDERSTPNIALPGTLFDKLDNNGGGLATCLPAIGRIEVRHHPRLSWVGTGWLASETIVVTNRHVAMEFAHTTPGAKFVFSRHGLRTIEPGIDFLQEVGSDEKKEIAISRVLYLAGPTDPDVALLELAAPDENVRPLDLAVRGPVASDDVVTVGYPAFDTRIPDQALVRRILGDVYDKKRLAPGRIIRAERDTLFHDCSTLGGNSGSPVIDMNSGRVVGLHYAGLYLRHNFAVPVEYLRLLLKKFQGKKRRARAPSPSTTTGKNLLKRGARWTFFNGARLEDVLPKIRGHFQKFHPQGVLDVRLGYVFENGWITDREAIVIVVADVQYMESVREEVGTIVGVPLEVVLASAFDLAEAVAPPVTEGLPTTHYVRPIDTELREATASRVVCHASPDAGWPTLREFIAGTREGLTVGMYDFTATHIRDAVRDALGTTGTLHLILQRGQAQLTGAKQHDITDEETVETLRRALDERMDHAWALVSGPNRVFATSYHIKVAVRDRCSVWLSSGNWQTSNQPTIQPSADRSQDFAPLTTYNREWHVVLEGEVLAGQFEDFLLHDMEQARDGYRELEAPLAPPVELLLEGRQLPVGRARYFSPLDISDVRVQPLLTPDNYRERILELLNSAQESILFQNQSLSILAEGRNEPGFLELLNALLEKQRRLDVRIILRGDFNPRTPLERLQQYGFDMSRVRCQNRCHNKGIVVDRKIAVVGSHNWTNAGTLANRDASVILYDERAAQYFAKLFQFDWDHLTYPRPDVPEALPELESVGERFTVDEIED